MCKSWGFATFVCSSRKNLLGSIMEETSRRQGHQDLAGDRRVSNRKTKLTVSFLQFVVITFFFRFHQIVEFLYCLMIETFVIITQNNKNNNVNYYKFTLHDRCDPSWNLKIRKFNFCLHLSVRSWFFFIWMYWVLGIKSYYCIYFLLLVLVGLYVFVAYLKCSWCDGGFFGAIPYPLPLCFLGVN